MTIEYLKDRADLNFEVDFRVNGGIGTIATTRVLIYSENGLFYPCNIIIVFNKSEQYAFNTLNLCFFYLQHETHWCVSSTLSYFTKNPPVHLQAIMG